MATRGDSMVLPDLTKLGIQLPAGVKYSLVVSRDSGSPTVDDLAAHPISFGIPSEPSHLANSVLLELTSQ